MNIIQVGCNKGNDHVYKYILENIDRIKNIYLIDVSKEAIEIAKENYKNIKNVYFYNIAICDSEDIKELEIFYAEDLSSGHLSSRKNHHTDHNNPNPINSFFIKAITINKFIEENNIGHVDILFIDTEGLDCKIVSSINLDIYNINQIYFEHMHSEKSFDNGNSEIYKNTIKKLINNNYHINKLSEDTIAIKEG